MIELRCVAVHPKNSKFFVGDICDITKLHMNDKMEKGVITIERGSTKTTCPFEFSKDKHLITKTEAFRVRLVNDAESNQDL